jgi:hypothetical protein
LPPNSTFLGRPCGCSHPSMTAPSGSSCIGIRSRLQAHLVLEESIIAAMSATRLYFQCPSTKRWFSTAFEKVSQEGAITGLFTIYQCRYCEHSHRYKGSEVRRSRPASAVPKPKSGQKVKSKGFLVRTRPSLSVRGPRLKDTCYGSLSDVDQKRAEAAQLSSTLFMLEDKRRCVDCGQFVGAKKSTMGNYFDTDPRPHERYKEPRQPQRKRDYGKRI